MTTIERERKKLNIKNVINPSMTTILISFIMKHCFTLAMEQQIPEMVPIIKILLMQNYLHIIKILKFMELTIDASVVFKHCKAYLYLRHTKKFAMIFAVIV